MKNKIIISIFILIVLTSISSVNALKLNNTEKNDLVSSVEFNGYINITALEAWNLMNNSEDGRQIPIDIRRWGEYSSERIETPNQEDWPRWFPYEYTSDGPGPIKNEGILLNIFMRIYNGKEIIIYCRTGRRTGISAQILVNHGFNGVIYNMVDGITEWKAIGLPTIQGF